MAEQTGAAIGVDPDELGDAFGEGIDLVEVTDDVDSARQQLVAGEVDLVLVAPEDGLEALQRGEQATFSIFHAEIDPVITGSIDLLARLSVNQINQEVLTAVVEQARIELSQAEGPLADALGGDARRRPEPAGQSFRRRDQLRDGATPFTGGVLRPRSLDLAGPAPLSHLRRAVPGEGAATGDYRDVPGVSADCQRSDGGQVSVVSGARSGPRRRPHGQHALARCRGAGTRVVSGPHRLSGDLRFIGPRVRDFGFGQDRQSGRPVLDGGTAGVDLLHRLCLTARPTHRTRSVGSRIWCPERSGSAGSTT